MQIVSKPLQQPKCSVIIPTHNSLEYLQQAVASVQAQSFMNLEIIVVDDDSKDLTWEWLQMQQKQDPRIRPLRVSVHSPAKARNAAITVARGELIAFLDADDTWLPQKLVHQVEFHNSHPDVLFSFSDYRHIGENGEDLGTCFEFWSGYDNLGAQKKCYSRLQGSASRLFAQNIVGTSTAMVKRSALDDVKGFDERLPSAEDWDLWLKLALDGPVAIGNYCDTLYLMRPESESSKTELRIRAMQQIYQRYQHAISNSGTDALRYAKARIATAEAENWLSHNDPARAMLFHAKALCLAPTQRRFIETLVDIRLLFKGVN
ncbi:glycosyltransferase family 2 protein [Echinimonas agarilytica]|uniref:Glycosyltransferase family 2 protein n=1 Tax=Echinimonas agarilytica TaxID=1215918 RepID=A0AA41W6E6_9GAMM|nr:glycosyltransferase family 2 protein [Echinimonas agarilytica]MCM2679533.1 glycosyltransferase family 2 protein [Echinimonas agarilytica]